MAFRIAEARKYLQTFDLQKLFVEEMGWDRANQVVDIPINNEYFKLATIAQKRGFAAFLCSARADGSMPDAALRYKIETQARKYSYEHLIIFTNKEKTIQKWQWVRREHGKPIARREYDLTNNQKGGTLLNRLQAAVFELNEEDDLTIIEVGKRIKGAFDLEKVTKKFYERFKDEHTAFLKFTKGIPDKEMQQWYVSITLNRLMFIYFMQKKQFLNKDSDYLRHHLIDSKKQGKDLFYSDFLCPLFFEGFAKRERTARVKKFFGEIPYLGGGIFEQNEVEELHGEKIQIPDKAFEELFDFFDEYRWHLDERALKEGNEINPDVLGYIFEKYINQKQMGAYYTKEDITGYISQNTIIPHIFDVVQKECMVAFTGDGSIWRHLQNDPDRYIYDALKYGSQNTMPKEIAIGEADAKRREGWNKSAPEEFALPTEIWREVVARRRRHQEVTEKLAGSAVTSINDLITLNLDIRQFAQDVIEDSDADLLTAFWHALSQIKILDPTVGSGAFLFAALNVLEPMYEACIERMRVLVKELDASGEKHSPKKYEHFRKALEQVNERPDEDYFIFKSIIINNLYGVDIMEEAVEICKLRLFLKLAAQVEADPSKENLGIEPLPDIDFNIRAGNTLVGFATREDVERSVQFGTVDGVQAQKLFAMDEEKDQLKLIEQKAEDVDRLYKIFRAQQTTYGGEVNAEDKKKLEKKLQILDDELNILLARQYAIHNHKGEEYKEFLDSHKPFHWFVEFYGIMREGGFDVIIGNPPYVEYSKVKDEYKIFGYNTEECGNLFAFLIERSITLLNTPSRIGLIVPTGSISSERMKTLQVELMTNFDPMHLSHYSAHGCPSTLFEGAFLRLTIICGKKQSQKAVKKNVFSSKYMKWYGAERPYLFQGIWYHHLPDTSSYNSIAKIENSIANSIWLKITKQNPLSKLSASSSSRPHFYYYNATLHWMKAFDFLPRSSNERDGVIQGSHYKEFHLAEKSYQYSVIAALNSNLFYLWFVMLSNCRDLSVREILRFPFQPSDNKEMNSTLETLAHELMKDYKDKSTLKIRMQKTTGRMELQEIDPRKSKPIIDEIDHALARHYGLSDEELDFIINYDVKYRMGAEVEEEE